MTDIGPVVLGVDVGATKILVGYVGRQGQVHSARRYPMDRVTQESTLASLRSAIAESLPGDWQGPAPVAIGLGLVGQTDPASGIWVRSINLPIRSSVPLGAELHERYGLPVALDNDVHAATLAELRLGTGRGSNDFVYVNVGTGLAAGLVCGGQLVRGAANCAGELGHMVVEHDSELCPCGRRGCLEPIASGGGLIAQVCARLGDYSTSCLRGPALAGTLTSSTIFSAADAGDPLASAVAARAVHALAIALGNLVNLLNPEAIALGGGVCADGWILPRLRAQIAAGALPGARDALRVIQLSPLSVDHVGMLGAAMLAWERMRTEGSP